MKISASLRICFFISFLFTSNYLVAQCCAGGSGSPIAGGLSQGVLQERQMELNTNFQFISTNRFYKKDVKAADSLRSFDSFNSTYEYFRLAYGLTKNFTFSIESGYYFKKKEIGFEKNPATTYETKGFGDLIFFPRYDVINWSTEKHRTEFTLGIGFKMPLGSYNDSAGNVEPFSGQTYYVSKPTSVQLSSGANDLIFYTFLFEGFTEHNFKLFANAMYIKKGWNPNGEKLGDYASVSLFAGKSLFNHLGLTLQARYEWVDKMKVNENVLLFGRPSNYFPEATGYKKVFVTPQISFTKGQITAYVSSDFPIYQYINSSDFYTQVGSQHQLTLGLSYRFYAVKPLKTAGDGNGKYFCPMHADVTSDSKGACPKCGMDLEKRKD